MASGSRNSSRKAVFSSRKMSAERRSFQLKNRFVPKDDGGDEEEENFEINQ
jgi:hypothetical protein